MATVSSIGKFQVVGELGTGAHSSILHIRRAADARHYALKVVPIDEPEDAKYLDQARHEFEVAQKLDHANLIKIYALETQRDWLFRIRKVNLLIEYVNGKTLDTIPRLNVARLVQVFAKIAAGLAHMHRRGVFHADLKPNNVMLSRSGDVKIIDYGLAWIKGQDKGRIQGTPEYMAPEQAKHGTVSERTDIYNLGATMYRLLTWRLPPSTMAPEGGLRMDSKTHARSVKPVSELNAEAPPALCDLVHRCLSYRADQRPSAAAEVEQQLSELVEEIVTSADDRLEMIDF
jgi:serine/threonine protein kinase